MEIANSTINFGRWEGSGPRTQSDTVTLSGAVTSASAVN